MIFSIVYKSPQADMGYDIADYKAIDPIYGTIEDVDHLIAELKKRGMKLMVCSHRDVIELSAANII